MIRDNDTRSFVWGHGDARKQRRAVILAGGDGSRLKGLTRIISGDERPKQFCPILGDRTLVEITRDRVSLKIRPDRIHYSLTAKHSKFYAPILGTASPDQMFVQPENKGTAPAILHSLLRLAMTAPRAPLGFFPSDHHFSNNTRFLETVEAAFRTVEANPESVLLVGIEPETAETAYGWIEPSDSLFGGLPNSVTRVARFWEKPTPELAARLLLKGCLWNSFVMVGRVDRFLRMIEKNLPDVVGAFRAAGPVDDPRAIERVYRSIDETNFSHDVLARSADELFVIRGGEFGWNDLGEPERVIGTAAKLGIRLNWMQAAA